MTQETLTKEKLEAFQLRLPVELKLAMAEIARQEKRSLNTQIIFALENYVKDSEKNIPLKLAA